MKCVDGLVIDAQLQVANNRSKALQMLLQAEELEAILARDNSQTADHIQLFSEVCSLPRFCVLLFVEIVGLVVVLLEEGVHLVQFF